MRKFGCVLCFRRTTDIELPNRRRLGKGLGKSCSSQGLIIAWQNRRLSGFITWCWSSKAFAQLCKRQSKGMILENKLFTWASWIFSEGSREAHLAVSMNWQQLIKCNHVKYLNESQLLSLLLLLLRINEDRSMSKIAASGIFDRWTTLRSVRSLIGSEFHSQNSRLTSRGNKIFRDADLNLLSISINFFLPSDREKRLTALSP